MTKEFYRVDPTKMSQKKKRNHMKLQVPSKEAALKCLFAFSVSLIACMIVVPFIQSIREKSRDFVFVKYRQWDDKKTAIECVIVSAKNRKDIGGCSNKYVEGFFDSDGNVNGLGSNWVAYDSRDEDMWNFDVRKTLNRLNLSEDMCRKVPER